jgi:CubicO group peptidase (beta-lactamase class C family)
MARLPRSTPAEQQVDPSAVLALLDALEARSDIEMHSLMVVRHGHVVAEGWWAPYSPDRVHLLYSVSKTFTATAAAFARDEGLLDLDDTVLSHFPELEDDVVDPRSRRILLRHVAAMASGHTRDTMGEAFAGDRDEPVRGFLTIPPDEEPGTVFAYNQPCTYALAAVIQRESGQSLSDYLRPRLFDPLGIGDVWWQSWPPGRELGFTGLHARTEDVAKLGQLYLQRGRWGEQQLIPEEWVEEATSKHVDNPHEPNVDWRQGYGYQFWMHRHGYRGDGAFGQFCVVLPEHDTVVATTASTEQMQAVLDAMWEHLLPGLGVRNPSEEAGEELASRLSGLRILPLGGSIEAPGGEESHRFEVVAGGEAPHVTAVTCRTTAAGLEVGLVEGDACSWFAVGDGEWALSSTTDGEGGTLPVAASGGWVDDRGLAVDVLFLESAHRFHVRATLGGGAEVTWNHVPLGRGRLADMHAPR